MCQTSELQVLLGGHPKLGVVALATIAGLSAAKEFVISETNDIVLWINFGAGSTFNFRRDMQNSNQISSSRSSAQNQPGPSQQTPQSSQSNIRPPTKEELELMNRQKVTPELINYIENFKFPFINDVSNYDKIAKIGQGTFGLLLMMIIESGVTMKYFREVFKARCRRTGRLVALKKILMENEKEGVSSTRCSVFIAFEFPITALREVKMLQKLKHKHITELIEICSSKGMMLFYQLIGVLLA
ncbi:unnamed protein product [Toxocara canis]|uniref:Protein kinase domain-containing protein n=1 Tax=Toxocara canis TaxID=6265 RepID=A0A183U2N2_TOXCA|nr:unnamed protein product [Toxocara canis]